MTSVTTTLCHAPANLSIDLGPGFFLVLVAAVGVCLTPVDVFDEGGAGFGCVVVVGRVGVWRVGEDAHFWGDVLGLCFFFFSRWVEVGEWGESESLVLGR